MTYIISVIMTYRIPLPLVEPSPLSRAFVTSPCRGHPLPLVERAPHPLPLVERAPHPLPLVERAPHPLPLVERAPHPLLSLLVEHLKVQLTYWALK